MVNREVKRRVVMAMASTATRLRVRFARMARRLRRRMQLRLATFSITAASFQRVTIRPSSMRTMRSASWAISSLWVIITIVCPNF